MGLREWWNEKRYQLGLGMQMQLDKYPDNDPRKKKLQEKANKLKGALEENDDDDQ